MGSEQIHVVEIRTSLIFKLWFLALLGVVFPSVASYYWPHMGWVGQVERAHSKSLSTGEWEDPWQAIDQKTFSSGWVRCSSLEDALALDRDIDDGNLLTGQLVLAEGGVAWLPQ